MVHPNSGTIFSDDDFLEIPHLNSYLEQKKVDRLKKSEVVSLWLKFFKEWFNISLDVKNILVLDDDKNPGDSMVIVPKEITLQLCLSVVKDKLDVDKESIKKIQVDIVPIEKIRRRKGTYLNYIQNVCQVNLIMEQLLLNLFCFYREKKYNNYNVRYLLKYLEIKSTLHKNSPNK